MKMRRTFAVLAVAAAVPAGLGAAADPPAKSVTLGGRGFATPVTVTFAAPKNYTVKSSDGYGGSWNGPRWKKLASATEGDSLLDFRAHSDFSARSAEQAARTKLRGYASWQVVASGPIAVPHVVKGRTVGTAKAFFLIRHNPGQGYEGWHKAAVGIPLGRGYPVLAVDFSATTPSSDAGEAVEGTPPSIFNRAAIEQALRGVQLNGNLAPQRIQARVRVMFQEPCCNARITGRVTDTLGHALVGVRVTLRKHDQEPCCGATTTATGAYTLNVPKRAGTGAFLLSVALGAVRVTSAVSVP